MRFYFLAAFVFLLFVSCNGSFSETDNFNKASNSSVSNTSPKTNYGNVPVYSYEVVRTYPHDGRAFTQGLVYHEGFFYESTGSYGNSTLRKVEPETGKILQKKELAEDYFAEGMTILNGKIYQITWQENTAFVYDANNLELLRQIKYQGSGWGLANDGTNLILSDGTHLIKFIEPETFNTIRTITVKKEDGKPVYHLNELEFVKGEIWANIWHSEEAATSTEHGFLPNLSRPNHIARIDPQSGNVIGWIDLGNISPSDTRERENTLNGIAYDAANDRIFVTGKNWKKIFEIKLKDR